MIRLVIIVLFFLCSCSPQISRNALDFKDDMTFDEFEKKLDNYAKSNPYPNIDD